MQNSNHREKIKEINKQRTYERLKELEVDSNVEENPIVDIIEPPKKRSNANQSQATNDTDLASLQDRFGVRKINRPIKDAQLTARIESKTLARFKEIVKEMYYPDKSNINETVTQIIRAFVEEYDRSHANGKQEQNMKNNTISENETAD